MATNYFPLIANATANTINELPAGDNLDLTGSNLVNAQSISTVGNVYFPTTNTGLQAAPNYLGTFDGSTQYLLVPSLPLIGTNQFTIEGWVNIASAGGIYGGTYYPVISWSSGGGGFRFFVGVDGTWSVWDGSSTILTPTSPSPGFGVGQWTHFVIQRNSSNLLAVYVNGVLQDSTTATNDWNGITGSGAWIGGDEYSSDYRMWGSISNLRYVLGQSVYTTNFTLPTKLLTSTQLANINGVPSNAITGTNTQLLTPQETTLAYGKNIISFLSVS